MLFLMICLSLFYLFILLNTKYIILLLLEFFFPEQVANCFRITEGMGRISQNKKSKFSLKFVYSIAKLPLQIAPFLYHITSVMLEYSLASPLFVLLLALSECPPHRRSGHLTQADQRIPSLWAAMVQGWTCDQYSDLWRLIVMIRKVSPSC